VVAQTQYPSSSGAATNQNNPFEMGVEQTQEIIIIIIKRMRKKIEQSLFAENT
jgi:hypothetical protein